MEKALESIKKRYSVRTYDNRKIESEKLTVLGTYLEENTKGPFGSEVRLKLVETPGLSPYELKQYVSYGNVKGAVYFIAGTVKKGEKAMEDFGYCMEEAILMATSLGLGTVWLGGSLNRSTFARELEAGEDEIIPAISPLGYASENRTIMDRVVRTMSGGKYRKEFGQLFFDGDILSPLSPSDCRKYRDVLEAVRLAPSASNKQPWRIIKEKGKDTYHIYMDENKAYNSAITNIAIQNNDMGIAMCHFELSARELGLTGSWEQLTPAVVSGGLVYISSWVG